MHAGMACATPAWRRLPDMLHARSAMGCTALGGCVYAIGGAGPPTASAAGAGRGGGGAGGTHRHVEVFDMGREEWLPLTAELACERKYTAVRASRHNACVCADRVRMQAWPQYPRIEAT